ncbi:hypothetical protein [Sulfurimonas sp.]
MKNAHDILKSIQNKPQFSKLTRYECIDKIKSLFSAPLQKMIKFAYIKNHTLFFVLNHPGAKQEFDNNIQSIKSALKFVTPSECEENTIQDIKAFVTHTPIKQEKFEYTTSQEKYTERAKGEFEIKVTDPKLKTLLLHIKKIIKENNESA